MPIDQDVRVFHLNVGFLLWRELPQKRELWAATLASWARVPEERALRLLNGAPAELDEIAHVAEATSHAQDDLSYGDLIASSGIDVQGENVRYFLATLEHGQSKELAAAVNVHETTISRWRKSGRPRGQTFVRFCDYFGIAPAVMKKEPLFLSFAPVSTRKKRDWVRKKVSEISDEELIQLFPAFKKLLEP